MTRTCPYIKNFSCVCIKIQRIFYSKTAPDYENSECWQWERNQPGSCYVRVICHLSNYYIWICHELPIQVWIKMCFIIIEEVFLSSLTDKILEARYTVWVVVLWKFLKYIGLISPISPCECVQNVFFIKLSM